MYFRVILRVLSGWLCKLEAICSRGSACILQPVASHREEEQLQPDHLLSPATRADLWLRATGQTLQMMLWRQLALHDQAQGSAGTGTVPVSNPLYRELLLVQSVLQSLL